MKLYIGFGANIGQREETIRKAMAELDGKIGQFVKSSSFYETKPVGFSTPNLFINAAALYETDITDEQQLLEIVQQTERQLGRRTKSNITGYRDRPIDIDVLMLEHVVVQTERISIPHPLMHQRRFVLDPLLELAPALIHPATGKPLTEYYEALNQLSIREVKMPSVRIATFVNTLLRQLSPERVDNEGLNLNTLRRVLGTRTTHIYIGYDEADYPVAMATLCIAASPSGVKAWAEDIVVDENCRHRGYGRALVKHLKTESLRLGAASLNLTSRPEREAANSLYRSEGFRLRETNIYRWEDQ